MLFGPQHSETSASSNGSVDAMNDHGMLAALPPIAPTCTSANDPLQHQRRKKKSNRSRPSGCNSSTLSSSSLTSSSSSSSSSGGRVKRNLYGSTSALAPNRPSPISNGIHNSPSRMIPRPSSGTSLVNGTMTQQQLAEAFGTNGSMTPTTTYKRRDSRPLRNNLIPSSENTLCMYASVWQMLRFQKKTIPLMSSTTTTKPVCVTGADGFLASWIVHELLQKGYSVRGTVQNHNDDVSGLLKLPNSEQLTIVETSLLTPEACDLAVQDCEFVIHTGTPTSCAVRDPLSEQQEPGVHSIGSRMHCIIPMMTNFIQACARARVKRVVLTSSVAAMADTVSPNSIINDACWNIVSSLEKNPHFLSLKLAEEAAWQLVDQLPRECRIDLVAINPGTLFGPALCHGKLAPGNQVIYDLITGEYSALVDLNWSMVDVRDCAAAHILALENSQARGRYICVHRTVWMKEIVEILSTNGFSGRDLPWRVGLPNWVARLPAYSSQLGQVGAALYGMSEQSNGRSSPYLNDKILEMLHVRFRQVEATVIESANDLLKWRRIKPWAEDHEAIDCFCCHQLFSFYRRKHHCRECGEIICADCSLSRAVVENLDVKARLCDSCVRNSIPGLLALLSSHSVDDKRKAVVALESLMANGSNHDYVTRNRGIHKFLLVLHDPNTSVSRHAAGALCELSWNVSSSLQMVLEGAVLQMLEIEEGTPTWDTCLQALRNIWKQINRMDFRRMLFAVARVSRDKKTMDQLQGNILLTFVHMMDPSEVPSLLPEGLVEILYHSLQSDEQFPRCAAAHAIKHLVPKTYAPDLTIVIPPYNVDNHEELFANASLSDLQFLVKGHIAPINAHKVVLFFRNAYFKNMFGSATSQKAMIEVDNCSYEVFSLLLRFLYTGRVEITSDIAQELLRASSFYQVFELQKRAEHFLSGEIRVDNVVELLCLANECNAVDLKRNCVPFLMHNIHAIVRLPAYRTHRVRTSEEVLKALTGMLGTAWEASYSELVVGMQQEAAAATEQQQRLQQDQKAVTSSSTRARAKSEPQVDGRTLLSKALESSPLPSLPSPLPSPCAAIDDSRCTCPPGVRRVANVLDPSTRSLESLNEDSPLDFSLAQDDAGFRHQSRTSSEDLSEGVC